MSTSSTAKRPNFTLDLTPGQVVYYSCRLCNRKTKRLRKMMNHLKQHSLLSTPQG